MPQAVHPRLREPGSLQQGVQVVVEVGRLERRAHAAGEDQIHLPPSRAGGKPIREWLELRPVMEEAPTTLE